MLDHFKIVEISKSKAFYENQDVVLKRAKKRWCSSWKWQQSHRRPHGKETNSRVSRVSLRSWDFQLIFWWSKPSMSSRVGTNTKTKRADIASFGSFHLRSFAEAWDCNSAWFAMEVYKMGINMYRSKSREKKTLWVFEEWNLLMKKLFP
jgi:hypothetical protein